MRHRSRRCRRQTLEARLARMSFELAQINIGRLVAPIDHAQLADFAALLDPTNAVADAAPGFIWRLQTDDGNATGVQAFEWDAEGSAGVIVNLSVWADVESLAAFVFGDMHREVMRRRREWFHRMSEAYTACWWVPAGHRPTTAEAEDRIRNLRANGSNPDAFTIRDNYPRPDIAAQRQAVTSPGTGSA
jgi:Domain of unknown function (DUF3291)